MEVIITNSSADAQRMFNTTTSQGTAYVNDIGAQQYVDQMRACGISDSLIQHVEQAHQHIMVERELTNELMAGTADVLGSAMNEIHVVNSQETLNTITPTMLNYLYSDPVIATAAQQGVISTWDDVKPVYSQTMWETVNTGTCTLKDRSITITEYINSEPQLTVGERIIILDSQEYVKDIIRGGNDLWSDLIEYY